ncbi:MAG: hypothetical protein WBG92_13775, partial [Thiohalocapsa sp.]
MTTAMCAPPFDPDALEDLADGKDANADIERLAALSPLEYDREREDAAKTLGVRVGTLDKEVRKLQPDQHTEAKGRAIELYEPEPWSRPVSGAQVLNEAMAAVMRHMVIKPEDAAA